MDMQSPSKLYDAYYYAHDCGQPYQRNSDWLGLFDGFAMRIVSDIKPKSVLDAGCAMGFLVEMLRQRGVEAWGIDISEYAIQNVHPDIRPYCQVSSILDPFPHSRYDLIVCIEILEHLPPQDAESAITNLCRHSDDILFSSTPYDYKEATHFNVQPPEYWAENFARQGFFRDVDFDAAFITPWAVRFTRRDVPLVRLVRDYERRFMPLWKENADLRRTTLELRAQLAQFEQHAGEMKLEHESQRAHIQEQREHIEALEKRLDTVYNSRSWKMLQRLAQLRKAPTEIP
jgi:SAM-dependent methyltransferase